MQALVDKPFSLKSSGMLLIALVVLALVFGTEWLRLNNGQAKGEKANRADELVAPISSLPSLLAVRPDALQTVDIARMNLLCAQGLPGAEGLDVNRCLAVLDEMATRVRSGDYFTNRSVTGTMRMLSRLILSGNALMALSSAITASDLGEV
jgi:hypothetical protein